MNAIFQILLIVVTVMSFVPHTKATTFSVNSQSSFDAAHDAASANDQIIWEQGYYSDIFMDITKDNLYIGAEVMGNTVFEGESRVDIDSDNITLEGLQFVGGNIGTQTVINTYGSFNYFKHLNIRAYTCYKYLRIRESSQFCEVTYCNFEDRLNLDDQNILSILVDNSTPGYHKIQYCSFKNFNGTGNDMGIEPIRIGLSTQASHISRSLVEYCYFTQCNGDGELISSKASENVYRFNTFENNPLAELVLRHGSDAIVYGNFFLNGKGGVRVREGQNHYIYNNYFYELDDRAIYLQNADSDPLNNINIAFNTIVDCSEVILGGSGSDQPTNVTFANNIFADADDNLFEDETGNETWIGNIADSDLGIPLPSSGITMIDPQLTAISAGFWGLSSTSPAVDAAITGYSSLPQYSGMDAVDTDIDYDIMGQIRPGNISSKDLGSNEYPHNNGIHIIATESNTGPIYNTSTLPNLPVSFSSFKVTSGDDYTILSWSTSSEINNEGFQIEHSLDGRQWQKIAFVQGAGNSNKDQFYDHNHQGLDNGLHYYRLKQLDFDGRYDYSNIIFTVIESKKSDLLLFPNPTTNYLNIESTLMLNQSATIKIFDYQGLSVFSDSVQMNNNVTHKIQIDHLLPGMYTLTVSSDTGNISVNRFTKTQ